MGLLFKKTLVAKQKKRILRLEDEMLSSHSAILGLEKKIAEMQKATNSYETADRNLKVS
ncbi:hypothetical protein [Parafilimonas sp.]|uniref:hypothetical protein n=1 Tax=Parafilimonas sp. TaxID=1969739 RepID=UPI0039E403A3